MTAAVVASVVIALALFPGSQALAVVAPTLGPAGSFAVLSGDGLTSQGTVAIAGDVGLGPGYAAPAFGAGTVRGTVHSGDGAWNQGHADLGRARDELGAGPCDRQVASGEFGGANLGPGTTCAPADANLRGTVTLDAGGDGAAMFLLRVPGTLTTAPGSEIALANGAQACNVFVHVTGAASVGQGTTLRGSLLTGGSVALGPSAKVEGRVLSSGGGVSLNANTISPPGCISPRGDLAPLAPSPASRAGGPSIGPPSPDPAPSSVGTPGDPGFGPLVQGDPSGPPLGGSGDDTAVPPAGESGFPPDLAARRDSIIRTGASDTKALVAALAPLAERGLSPEQIAQVGYGRFPVGGAASYTHDWWFPRFGPGWRLHEGSDIFAERGTPVRSPAEGTVRLNAGGLGGTTANVVEPSGTYYYLAHLAGYAPGLVDGAKVTTGQVVGYVGDSGNARGTPPHLHFEVHPGGGGPVDPKPVLDRFLSEAVARVPTVLATYGSADDVAVTAAPASALMPLPAVPPTPAAPPAGANSPGGLPTSTLLWVLVAAVAGLAFGKVRERPLAVPALVRSGVPYETTRPTVRSLSRRIAAARRGETRAKGRQIRPRARPRLLDESVPGATAFESSPVATTSAPVPRFRSGARTSPEFTGLPGEVDFRRWLIESLDPTTGLERTERDERRAEERLVEWAQDGFGRPVPCASRPLVEDAIRVRSLPAAEAEAIRGLCLATSAIHPVKAPAGSDLGYLTAASAAALAASSVPTLVCCASGETASAMERRVGFRPLTGLPALGIDQVLQEVAAWPRSGFPPGTVIIMTHAFDVPSSHLERLAGHLATSGGGLRLLVDGPPVLGVGAPQPALPRPRPAALAPARRS